MTKICVFGASTVSDQLYLGFDCWVTKLRRYLGKMDEENSVFNLGIVSETSNGLLKRIDLESNSRNPDIIIVKIGTNDSRYNNKDKTTVETPINEFAKNIHRIISICKKCTKKIIFIENTPCNELKTCPTIWNDTEYFTNQSIKEYNNIIKLICEKEKIYFVELFDNWIKINYKKLLDKEDGLHPNSRGHKKIFEIVKDFLVKNNIV